MIVLTSRMKFALDERLESQRVASSCASQATPTTPSWKNSGDSKPSRRRSTEWNKRRPARSNRFDLLEIHLGSTDEENHLDQFDQTPLAFDTLSPRSDDTDPFRRSSSPQSPPSTPQRPRPPPPSILASAPGRLQSGLFTNLTTSPENAKHKSWSPEAVDDKVIEKLRSRLTGDEIKKRKKNEAGCVYLFEVVPVDDRGRTIMKIGSTGTTEKLRMQKIWSECKHFSMKRGLDLKGNPHSLYTLRLYRKAEKLAQAHLVDHTYYDFACACKKRHKEYFDVDTATAQSAIQCWRAFCESNPYDAEGELRPFWKHRLDHRRNLPYWGSRAIEGRSELESRLLRWEVFANPTQFEIFWFHLADALSKTWPWRLHIITGLQGLIIAFLVAPSLELLSIWLSILVICIFWDEGTILSNYLHIMRTRLTG